MMFVGFTPMSSSLESSRFRISLEVVWRHDGNMFLEYEPLPLVNTCETYCVE
jgi:hypothetical protein